MTQQTLHAIEMRGRESPNSEGVAEFPGRAKQRGMTACFTWPGKIQSVPGVGGTARKPYSWL